MRLKRRLEKLEAQHTPPKSALELWLEDKERINAHFLSALAETMCEEHLERLHAYADSDRTDANLEALWGGLGL